MKKILGFLLLVVVLFGLGFFAHWTDRARTPNLPNPPLKDLAAKHNIELGDYASLKRLNDKPYTNILTSQFSFITVDGEPNWQFNDGALRPSRTTYNYSNIDKVMSLATTKHMAVQMHHLVWGEEKWLPDWLKGGDYTPEQLLDIMKEHIQTVGSHYAGQVREWTVVNEAFSRGLHIQGLHDWWADHTGGQAYIDQAFIWAHEADPNAKLLYNDFATEIENQVSDAAYNYIKDALGRGIPINGMGMQMHIDGSHPPKKDDMIYNMQRFGALGVGVYVTELDVNMNDVKGSENDKRAIEGNIYYEVMRACIESKVCHSFDILGITDMESWYNEMGVPHAIPLPFDTKYQPKPAYYSLRQALSEN